MRERLLVAFLALTALTVLLYAVPRSIVRVGNVNDQAQTEVSLLAQVASEVVDARLRAGLPAAGSDLALYGEDDSVVYRDARGPVLLDGPAVPRGEAVVATLPVPFGGQVEVARPRSAVRAESVRQVVPIALTGLVALVVAAAAAVLISRRLSAPFAELAASAERMGQDDGLDGDLPPYRMREADAIAAALRASSLALASTLRHERDFARNVAHQLRTPLTGIRMQIEEIGFDAPGTDVEPLLREIDRLADTITLLLSFSRRQHLGEVQEVAPAEVVAEAVRRWQPLAADAGRSVANDAADEDQRVMLPRGAVDQVLDVLVHNALRHGSGTVRLGLSVDEATVQLTVTDEGSGLRDVPDRELFVRRAVSEGEGEGLGLALCSQLASVLGGRLQLASREPTTFVLTVPR